VTLTLAEVAEHTLGWPVRESLPTLLGRGLDRDEHERLVRRKALIYERVSGGIVSEVRGAVAFVRRLSNSGVRAAGRPPPCPSAWDDPRGARVGRALPRAGHRA
jgi:hypothetical protein